MALIIYNTETEENIRKMADEAVQKATEWFEKNPERMECRAKWVYGSIARLRRGQEREDMDKEIELVLKNQQPQ